MPSVECFPKSLRLRRRYEFLKVQNRGLKVSTDMMLALALPNGLAFTRLGLTVSNKVGNSVVRNRIRRRLRQLFRTRRNQLPSGLDVVLIARAPAKEAELDALSRAFDVLCARLGERCR